MTSPGRKKPPPRVFVCADFQRKFGGLRGSTAVLFAVMKRRMVGGPRLCEEEDEEEEERGWKKKKKPKFGLIRWEPLRS